MNKEIKEKWISALRSGEYTKGLGQLKNSNGGFCCLGVLCDLYQKENPENSGWQEDYFTLYSRTGRVEDTDSFYLPETVRNWAELKTRNPGLSGPTNCTTLSSFNDSGCTFKEIADIIEENF